MKVQVDIVQITPPKAAEMLENLLSDQRPLSEVRAKGFAEEMSAVPCRFRLSSDALVQVKGKTANGQHRLWGVVLSNTTQPFILLRTDDEELYKILDCGKSRSVADVVHVAAGSNVTAVANLALAYQHKTITALGFKKKNSRVELINFIETHTEKLSRAVRLSCTLSTNHQNLVARTAPSAFHFLCEPLHGQRSEEFLNHVYSGDLPESISYLLRERFMRARLEAQQMITGQMGLALFIKAFNLHYSGSKASKATMRMIDGEAFPEIVKPTMEGVKREG